MELAAHQNQALQSIISNYKRGETTISIVMPAGTGKTLLSAYVVKEFIAYKEINSIAYITKLKTLAEQFNHVLNSFGLERKKIKTFTTFELDGLIKAGSLGRDDFQVIIIDDLFSNNQDTIDFIYDYFTGFKISFSREEPKKMENSALRLKLNSFTYSIDQAISDDYLIKSQQTDSVQVFENLKDKIEKIEIGTDWSKSIKSVFTQIIEDASRQNDEFLKILELVLSGKINAPEIIEMSRKKEQLEEFNKLLNDNEYFKSKQMSGKGMESVWQKYFESNPWIFGFGLNYIFNSPLEGKGLEQTVAGFSVTGSGKRTDALLHTTGLIQTLCFGEIKTHKKKILKEVDDPYRSESWAISDELAGGIAQVQRTIQKSLMNISEALSIPDDMGYKSKGSIYLYKPKSFLIIGSLDEFRNEHGDIHEHKFSSFELFRRSISDIEIITFDELYQRAYALVNKRLTKNS